MATLLDSIKNSLTPITDRLVEQFKLGPPAAPQSTPNFVTPRAPAPVASSTPAADALRSRFFPPASSYEPSLSPFEKNISSAITSGVHAGASSLDSFFNAQRQNIEDFATGKLTLHPDDWISGMKTTALGSLKLTGTIAQGFNEGIFRIGSSLASASLPGYDQERKGSSLVESLTGNDTGKTDTYQQIYMAAHQWATGKGATTPGANTFAGFATLGTLFMDDPGIGPEAKAAFKLSVGSIADLAKADTDEAVKTIIKAQNPGVSDKVLEFVTPLFRSATTPEDVKRAAQLVTGAAKTAAANTEKRLMIEKGKEGYVAPPELSVDELDAHLGRYNTPEIMNARTTSKGEPTLAIDTEERNALREKIVHDIYGDGAVKQERRLDIVTGSPASGKSTLVEELAREHGSIAPDSDAIKKQLPEYGLKGEGSQVVHTESTALAAQVRALARERGDNTILQMIGQDAEQIKKHIQIYKDNGYDVHLHHVELAPEKAAERAASRFKEGGHFVDPQFILRDIGLKPSRAYDTVKSDERLTSFQKFSNDVERGQQPALVERGARRGNEAPNGRGQRGSSGVARGGENAKGKAVSPNLLKRLASSRNPYDVLNVLKNEFPNLPDRVLDRVVQRFVKLKRTETMEGLLKSVANLDRRFAPGGGISLAEETAAAAGKETLPKGGAEVLDQSVPKATRKLMRQDQKVAYIKSVKDKFDDPKEAVFAQQEYDRIWDDMNQKVVHQYEDLTMHKSFLEDTLAADDEGIASIYKRLFTGPNKKNLADDATMELQEIHNRAARHKKAVDNYRRTGASGDKLYPGNPGKLTKTEEFAVDLDGYLQDAGIPGGDFTIAQEKLERYASIRAEVKDMAKQIQELKPRVREARILQQGLEEIAVVPREHVKAIDSIATVANVRDYFKDISGFSGYSRDLTRNFEHFFGKKYAEVKKAVLDPFDEAKGRFVDENKRLGDALDTDVVKKFGFRRGSKESAAIQRFGDSDLEAGLRYDYKDLVENFGKEKADKIVAADKWFRSQYDTLIDELNVVRKKIYPNSPSKLIAKRKNYYRHFEEMNDTWGDALREFFDTPSGIDPNLVGLSEFTKAKSRFLPFAEERKTKATDLDAIGGFVNYIPMFAYAKQIDPQISVFRYLRSKLAEAAPRAGETVTLDSGKKIKTKGAEAMLRFLDNFARDLAGNTNPVDRFIQDIVGRKTIRTARFINNRMKANTVGGNLGSALAQIANVPAGIADTKLYAGKGLTRSLGGLLVKNEPMAKSIFLKERYAKSVNERFPFQFKDKPFKASGDLLRKQTGWLMTKADEVGTRFIWNSEYEKALGKKVEDPVKYADDMTRKLVAGRGIGEVPLGQKALTSQFTIPFTLEVANAWWIMKDWVSKKDFTALVTFFAANYVLNEISEKTRGSRITFDPINATIEGANSLLQEAKAGHVGRGAIKLIGREAGEILANVPFGQQLAAILPDSAVQSGTQTLTGAPMTKQEVFGNSTAGRYGTPLIVSGLQDAVYRLLPPVGGLQLKKTYDGIRALISGHAEDAKGNSTFKVPASPQNVARALFFGANATSESRKYFDDRTDLFNRIDRQGSETFIRQASAEDDWAHMKKMIADGDSKGAGNYLAGIAAKDKLEATAIAKVAADEKAGLNSNDRLIGMLNVTNGERAKYIVGQLKKLKSGKEKAAYIADLSSKKLISKIVVQQIAALYSVAK